MCSDVSKEQNTQQNKHKLTKKGKRIVQNRLDTNYSKKEEDLSQGRVDLFTAVASVEKTTAKCLLTPESPLVSTRGAPVIYVFKTEKKVSVSLFLLYHSPNKFREFLVAF